MSDVFDAVMLRVAVTDVLKAALTWQPFAEARYVHLGDALEPRDRELMEKVCVFRDMLASQPNRPAGFVLMRPWLHVMPGWFVKTPKGDWLEVLKIKHAYGESVVTLLINGTERTFTYSSNGPKVSVRMGTKNNPEANAMEAVKAAFPDSEILEMDWS